MLTDTAYGNSRLSFWLRARQFAVPLSMIESATARRRAGDWAGACAAAGFDVDFDPRAVARTYGADVAARLRADLRHLAPDLLRWHMPRIAPDGLLRPGLTIALAGYADPERGDRRSLHLVARTAPAWAESGQRISLALWDGSRSGAEGSRHPHPRPSRRFRLDLHRHLWDARRTDELRLRSPADRPSGENCPVVIGADAFENLPEGQQCATSRWAAEAGLLLRAEKRPADHPVLVRISARQRLVLTPAADAVGDSDGAGDGADARPPRARRASVCGNPAASALPVLPYAATWTPPDLELLRTGSIEAEQLHPLVASALVPDCSPTGPPPVLDLAGRPRPVECRGAVHHIALVDGVLTALDHDADEVRREDLLAALTGTPLPCLQAIDTAHRRPTCLTDVRERLNHGDLTGALTVVENLLGPEAVLRDGALRDELEKAARERITYGLYRAGLLGPSPDRVRADRHRPRDRRARRRGRATRFSSEL
ncbi:hypothetical protein [Streptomyces sp. NPDC018584]|uniref:hypothetical protein n=1 Tax=unclassified Streptomyces TaxID=2593676 RepID=UPI00378887C5